jgi:hypothetical protein
MLKIDFIETGILPEFYQNRFFPIEFLLPKTFLPKPICIIGLDFIYLGLFF